MTDTSTKEQLKIMQAAIYLILKNLEAAETPAKFGQLKVLYVSKLKGLIDEV